VTVCGLDPVDKMQKVLIYLALGATLTISGCSSSEKQPEYRTSALERLPFVYKMTVQQGNIITEENVDRLQPGMTKSQVRFLLGTPMLTDMFHADRWDYTYTIRRGHQDMQRTRLALFFQDDALVRVQGDIRPDPNRAAGREPVEMIVEVPDWEDNRGFIAKTFSKLGVDPAE
jgi:outer membrane protein assembly factor BamE